MTKPTLRTRPSGVSPEVMGTTTNPLLQTSSEEGREPLDCSEKDKTLITGPSKGSVITTSHSQSIHTALLYTQYRNTNKWNARGLLRNCDDVQELLHKHSPKVLCVQETHLKPKHTYFLINHVIFREDRDDAIASSGGVAIILDESVVYHGLQIQTALEAVAVCAVVLNKLVTICSVYISPQLSDAETRISVFCGSTT